MGNIRDSDRLAIAIYNATIMDNRAFVQMADIDKQLTAEGVDCEGAKHTLIRRGVVGKSRDGTYALTSRGITHVRWVLHSSAGGHSDPWNGDAQESARTGNAQMDGLHKGERQRS